MYGHTGDHIFLINEKGNEAFETTFTCPTGWISINQLFANLNLNPKYEMIYLDNSPDNLVSLYLVSVINYNYNNIKNEAFELLKEYPSEDPSYIAMRMQVNNKEGIYNKLYDDYETFLKILRKYSLVGAFATVIQLVGIIADQYFKRDRRLLILLDNSIELLELSYRHNPHNDKIKGALTYLRAVQRRELLVVKRLPPSKVPLPKKITLSKIPSLI